LVPKDNKFIVHHTLIHWILEGAGNSPPLFFGKSSMIFQAFRGMMMF